MSIKAILLGTAQDAGVPQTGCTCPNCQRAWANPEHRRRVVCLGLVDETTNQSWLIDATPDVKEQLHALNQFAPNCTLAGILITHVHMGHYTGLIQFGPEAKNSNNLPVYTTESVENYLRQNAPWSFLENQNNIAFRRLTYNNSVSLSSNLHITPIPVPHRDEFSDTLAFVVKGPQKQLFFCPDIDSWDDWNEWDKWNHDVREFVSTMDVALLDAPFYSAAELPGRDMSKIRHPLVTDTMARLAGVDCRVYLTHLNHSNPLLSNGPEREQVEAQGFTVSQFGQQWDL